MSSKENLFISREVSTLLFNERVLDESECISTPLLEKIRFVAICSSNMDEFFMVRVAGLRQLIKLDRDLPDPAGVKPSEQLIKIRKKVEKILKRQHEIFFDKLLPELSAYGVRLKKVSELSSRRQKEIARFFAEQILPVLTPIALGGDEPFPVLASGRIEIALSLRSSIEQGGAVDYAILEVPEMLPRFFEIKDGDDRIFIRLEDIIMENLAGLFNGFDVLEKLPFRITRDMDFNVESDGVEDLMSQIERRLLERKWREPIRLEIAAEYSEGKLAEWLHGQFDLEEMFRYKIKGFLNLKQLFELAGKIDLPQLNQEPRSGLDLPLFDRYNSSFEAIRSEQYILNAPPFLSFQAVIDLLNEAADDPNVLAIKQTLYRVSGDSPVVRALQRAADNGKQVTVVLELKARFDENNNILWAKRLEEHGAHVIYGVRGLKIHSKALLIIRREEGAIRRYVHLSTGNYNDKTAKTYTDLGIMTDDEDLAFDISSLFNVMTGFSIPPAQWRKVSVAPFDLREKIIYLIEREIALHTKERPGRIIAKMNGFTDQEIVMAIHRAADAGVEISLIVRGVCCFRPKRGQKNLRIISIIDHFLEHSRIYYFGNGGDGEYYLSSADWMFRNLSRRIELLFPVEDPEIQEVLQEMLRFQLEDESKGRVLLASGHYTKAGDPANLSLRSQVRTYDYFRKLIREDKIAHAADVLPVESKTRGKKMESE